MTVIEVNNLSKKYFIGHQTNERYLTFREVLNQKFKSFGKAFLSSKKYSINNPTSFEEFWALKNITFEVNQGDRVGIIGRNGAGKTTLLKILSRITEPTEGQIKIKGRIASLLEVGTGFHPELTGRENIFLNGAILGMTRNEIKKKFDEIVDFAEVEKFLDTPVKRYSSGMYVRLAFAVAAHLEPEILLVDEVLAVGDAEFQKKCLGKMEDVSRNEGRTVLFVSHNMTTIESLCNRCIVIKKGQICFNNNTSDGIDQYLNSFSNDFNIPLSLRKEREGYGRVLIDNIILNNGELVKTGNKLTIRCEYHSLIDDIKIMEFGLSIWSERDARIISLSSDYTADLNNIPRSGSVICTIDNLPLVAGKYYLNYFVSSTEGIEDYLVHALKFEVNDSDFFGTGKSVDPHWGCIVVKNKWKLKDGIRHDSKQG